MEPERTGARASVVAWRFLLGVALIAVGAAVILWPEGRGSPAGPSMPLVDPTTAEASRQVPPSVEDVAAGTSLSLRRLSERNKQSLRAAGVNVYRNSGALIVTGSAATGFQSGDLLLGGCKTKQVTLFDQLVEQMAGLAERRPWCFRVLRWDPREEKDRLVEIGGI